METYVRTTLSRYLLRCRIYTQFEGNEKSLKIFQKVQYDMDIYLCKKYDRYTGMGEKGSEARLEKQSNMLQNTVYQ